MKNVFCSDKRPRALILSYKADRKLVAYVKALGFDLILTTKAGVDPRINDHPDIQIRPLGKGEYMVARDCYDYYQEALKSYDIKLYKSEKSLSPTYPGDCLLNVAQISSYYITKEHAIDPTLEAELKKRGLEPIYQKQAYSKCMTICFEDFAITNDRSIERALKDKNLEVHYISSEGIGLDGFNIGFLGGSCGIIGDMKLFFTGDVSYLKDYKKLKEILDKKGVEILSPEGPLLDLGSIISIV